MFRHLFFFIFMSSSPYENYSNFDYLPKLEPYDNIIIHDAYSLKYMEEYEQASWVAYVVDGSKLNGEYKRKNNFRSDTSVSTKSASLNDYRGSGFDRGHLAPAAVFSYSELAMSESFFMSNMSPQLPGFNRGIWKQLEAKVRTWSTMYDKLYVVSGPCLNDNLTSIGENNVAVPEYYYKVILCNNKTRLDGIGFIIKNGISIVPLESLSVSIDSVEYITNIDFFCHLKDEDENKAESLNNYMNW